MSEEGEKVVTTIDELIGLLRMERWKLVAPGLIPVVAQVGDDFYRIQSVELAYANDKEHLAVILHTGSQYAGKDEVVTVAYSQWPKSAKYFHQPEAPCRPNSARVSSLDALQLNPDLDHLKPCPRCFPN